MSSFKSLYNYHKYGTCIVIGNGPSLRNCPNEFLRKYPTFGTNRIYLREEFVPTYYVCVNPLVLGQFGHEIATLPCTKFTPDGVFGAFALKSAQVPLFSYCPDQWIYEGYTVTFVALQLAFFMGFETVLLVGVDHRYLFEGSPNEPKELVGEDPNHFHPDYFANATWNNPDLAASEASYQAAMEEYQADGRKIHNLTPNTALEVFPRSSIDEW